MALIPSPLPLMGAVVSMETAQIFFLISIIALAFSVGLFVALIYLLTRGQFFQRSGEGGALLAVEPRLKELEERVQEIQSNLEKLSKAGGDIASFENKLGEVEKKILSLETKYNNIHTQLSKMVSSLSDTERRVKALETRINYIVRTGKAGSVQQPIFQPAKRKEAPRIGEMRGLEDLKLYVPNIQYAALVTSQGYIVEKYGNISDDLPKLLEVAKISEKFTNSREINILRSDARIAVFHIGKSEDLDVYGIIAFPSDVSEEVIKSVEEALTAYYDRKYSL